MMLNPVIIRATTIPDAWHQLILSAPDNARLFDIDHGSFAGVEKRLEFDTIFVQITHPEARPFEPDLPPHMAGVPPPVEPGYIEEYTSYIMDNLKQPGEDYTYGSRLRNGLGVDQIEKVISIYKRYGYRNNQLVMNVGLPTDRELNDPPCLQLIDTRIQDGKLHFHIIYRSWDLWSGFPANLGGIQYLKEYMAGEIGVDPGESLCYCKGAHYYGYVVDLVMQRCLRG